MSEVVTQTLHIVARELNNELNDARAALENFGEQQDDVRFLENCRERLHQVHGALRVAEVHGAALLAEEMEQVARYLVNNFAEKRHLAEGLDALMRAMVQLPTYLERVLGGGRDMALILLPLLNDLRAVRGHALLSEGTLLLLNLTSEKQASPAPLPPGEHILPIANWARKLRPRFQLGLLGWIKGERPEQNLDVLAKTAEKLEQVATTQSVFQLWWVIGAVIESLREGGLEGSASLKRLLGHADREMRRLYEQGEEQYAARPPVELLNNLLYYLARASVAGARVSAVRASFRLSELLPVDEHVEAARESLAAPSIKLMKTVATAIKEDLGRVKDALDIFVRKNGTQGSELAPQLELLRKIGDTLGVLGLGELRDKVQAEIAELQSIVEQRAPITEALLMRVASTLIKIEDGLDEQLVGLILPTASEASGKEAGRGSDESAPESSGPADDIEFRQVSEAVLRECIVNMARVKEAIALAVEKPREVQVLDQVPALIRGITAGMLMLGKTRAVELTESIGQALAHYIHSDQNTSVRANIPQEALDRLADAIVAVEYYMETLHAGRADPWYMLDNAEACLQALKDNSGATANIQHLRELGDHANTIAVEPSVSARTMVIDRPAHDDRTALLTTVAQATQVIPTQQALKQAAQSRETRAPTAPPPQMPSLSPPNGGHTDPEFVELFIEEARDEIAKLDRLFPLWDENPQETDALTQIRRSFHTLKGSGRMVGAIAIGELAWSIENMLNRVINKTLERTPEMMSLMRRAVAAIPELVEQLESGRATQTDVAALVTEATAIANVRDSQTRKSTVDSEANAKEVAGDTAIKKIEPIAPSVIKPAAPSTPTQTSAPTPTSVAPPRATVQPIVSAMPETMDAQLQEIFSKEIAGHLAAIREYVASCALLTAPYPVTEALYRACHTLSGTAKTAGARQGIKIAEPLNHYVRKLYDNGVGLPAAGMQVLRDSVRAIENVVEHINESTGYFLTHSSIVERVVKLEQSLDGELTSMAVALEASAIMPMSDLPPERFTPRESLADEATAFNPAIRTADPREVLHYEQQEEHGDDDVIELSFDASGEDRELGLSSPTQISRALSLPKSGDTVDVALDPTAIQNVIHAEESAALFAGPEYDLSSAEHTLDLKAATANHFFARKVETNPAESQSQVQSFESHAASSVTPPTEIAAATQIVVETAAWAANYEPQSLHNEPASIPHVEATTTSSSTVASPVPTASPVGSLSAQMRAETLSGVSAELPVEADEEAVLDADYDADVAAIFTEEATELLDVADAALASWTRDRNNKSVAFELKRALHTLKGGARMAGIRAMGDLSHELESLMEYVESGRIAVDQNVLGLLQASLDELHRMRDIVSNGRAVPTARNLLARIRVASGVSPAPAAPPKTLAPAESVPTLNAAMQVMPVAPEPETKATTADSQVAVELGHEMESEPVTMRVMAVDESDLAADVVEEFHATELVGDVHSSDTHEAPELETPIIESVAAPSQASLAEQRLSAAPLQADAADEIKIESIDFGDDAPATDDDVAEVEIDLNDSSGANDNAAAPAVILPPGRDQAQPERGEVARVDAELLDLLLNNAGEVSILRSRLEQQTNSIEFNLAELGRTVTRLKDQLRKLELETEAQIMHGHQDEKGGRTDFDPLEMDRYSNIQQLSRALAESVSDVASIEGLLESMARETQNLLLQQSRVVTEVQNGLMRTRMVPFQRHVQRLSRIVRQVAGETGKRAELVVSGASGELDRQVLERMLPPLEHMLRNSVVHGIETPDERRAANKSEAGTIRIALQREGSEMIMIVEDDGRGIDVKAVRERAKARGLLQPGRNLTDEEALQLVLEPGFSTATAVTQHAGRGVGMDVVVAEIKKLGGALFTKSTPGHGVRFTIRLPFTLAISQALIVSVGDETYALPLPTVEGVARVPRAEVLKHLAEEESTFSYGPQTYRFQHLGAFIGAPPSTLPDADLPVPVILINAGEHSTGLVVDELVGNREIVVKPVGPQVSGIRGVAGATILGDGRIVIILDMGALVRSGWRGHTEVAAPTEDRRTFALVVDDSITVRRVTQRLLERNGMRVATAKDGVDALSVMQEQVPDIILLDIEMPRMDGYELAAHVRNDARLAEIPIVMITSRVGEKHRARAIELGVNDYLGKPYQENQLLDAIEPLVDARRRRMAANH